MQRYTMVFDLDGTLVDTAPDLIAATNHALASRSIAPIQGAVLRGKIGHGARHMIEAGLNFEGINLSQGEVDQLLEIFLAHYEANITRTSLPFDGAVDALTTLSNHGFRLAVCTNKREALARSVLDGLNLTRFFAGIAGRDTFDVHKPHPGHILRVAAAAGGDAARTVMVGDTHIDIDAGRAAGSVVIGCSFGYSEQDITQLGADHVIEHYSELLPALHVLLASGTRPATGSLSF